MAFKLKYVFLGLTGCLATFIACTKFDTTTIGDGLIPAVDNISTFADTLPLQALQIEGSDSTLVNINSDQVFGTISNDPIFGTTQAALYLQPKPASFPFSFTNATDTLAAGGVSLDSVVLCIAYKGYWGDKNNLQNINVRCITDNTFSDSSQITRRTNYKPTVSNTIYGTAQANIDRFADTTRLIYTDRRDSVWNVIRIKLNNSFAQGYLNADTAASNPLTNDSLFRRVYHGLELSTQFGSALYYVNLNTANTRLEIHYKKNKVRGIVENTAVYWPIVVADVFDGQTVAVKRSANANFIARNKVGFPASNPNNNEMYIQSTSGSYIEFKAPTLSMLNNRIVHRAEVILEQVPTAGTLDDIYTAPNFLYLDTRDSTMAANWRPVYFDLNPNNLYNPDIGCSFFPQEINYDYYGGNKRFKTDAFGNGIVYYNFNITRHVQQIVTRRTFNYTFRVYAPTLLSYPQYLCSTTGGSFNYPDFPFPNSPALGRVKIGGPNNPNYRFKLRIIYSKI
jgi:hypothetical protein